MFYYFLMFFVFIYLSGIARYMKWIYIPYIQSFCIHIAMHICWLIYSFMWYFSDAFRWNKHNHTSKTTVRFYHTQIEEMPMDIADLIWALNSSQRCREKCPVKLEFVRLSIGWTYSNQKKHVTIHDNPWCDNPWCDNQWLVHGGTGQPPPQHLEAAAKR